MKKIKIGILGIGAIGSVVTSGLWENPILEIHCFNRSSKKNIRIQTPEHFLDFKINTKAVCQTSRQYIYEKMELDWLIICLKEYHFRDAQDWFEKLIFPKTKIAVIRNGIELKNPLLPYTSSNQILECMVDCPVQIHEDGFYQQFKNPMITSVLGKMSKSFAALFSHSKFTFQEVEDFKTASWEKLIESASLGAITCLSGETCWIFEDEKMKNFYKKLLEEAVSVAKADGAILSDDFVNVLLGKLKSYPKEKGSSMLMDRLLGRPIELGAKNGAIVRLGKKHNIPTSLNDSVCLLLEKINRKV